MLYSSQSVSYETNLGIGQQGIDFKKSDVHNGKLSATEENCVVYRTRDAAGDNCVKQAKPVSDKYIFSHLWFLSAL